jgi:hypothetical protein
VVTIPPFFLFLEIIELLSGIVETNNQIWGGFFPNVSDQNYIFYSDYQTSYFSLKHGIFV